jgi:hypothetical protein
VRPLCLPQAQRECIRGGLTRLAKSVPVPEAAPSQFGHGRASSRITGSPLLAHFAPAFGGGAERRCDGTWDRRIGQADVLSQNMDHEITETSPIERINADCLTGGQLTSSRGWKPWRVPSTSAPAGSCERRVDGHLAGRLEDLRGCRRSPSATSKRPIFATSFHGVAPATSSASSPIPTCRATASNTGSLVRWRAPRPRRRCRDSPFRNLGVVPRDRLGQRLARGGAGMTVGCASSIPASAATTAGL